MDLVTNKGIIKNIWCAQKHNYFSIFIKSESDLNHNILFNNIAKSSEIYLRSLTISTMRILFHKKSYILLLCLPINKLDIFVEILTKLILTFLVIYLLSQFTKL